MKYILLAICILSITSPSFAVVDPSVAVSSIDANTVIDVIAGAIFLYMAGQWIMFKAWMMFGK